MSRPADNDRSDSDHQWTATELSRFFHTPIGTIYRWASEDRWPRTSSRPVRYSMHAATVSATRRRRTPSSLLTCAEVTCV